MATLDTEIRKLQPIELCTLAHILNQADAWKTLMAAIPSPDNPNHSLFNHEHFKMIEQAIRQQQRSGAEIFLSEWSTLGKQRPTCRSMLDLLVKAELFRAADYLAVDILKGNPPVRPNFGPAATIDVSENAIEEILKQQAALVKTSAQSTQDQEPLSWSMHFAEKPVHDVTATFHSEKAEDKQEELSDFIKFSETVKSGLLKFSDSEVKVQDWIAKDQTEVSEDYVLQEARSEDIPLCVRENVFQEINSRMMSTTTQETETATTIDSSDFSESTIASEEVQLPNISQNVIPVVVMEYNEKEKGETD
ncbi:uncharacterized protein LOC100122761 [Nasonia vitripennis]|uniref:Tube Death domain-containing protein n=1 Tax=Nasonia vitripennis TaxID=7425 RepID=A0A7M7QIF4_NASVI|nr:uncharacterized protein LOC100122761 [Nasonia vitripennis]XP_031788136.1 uncharacterized protein LOC100122761 [Nasonia vitripennis]